MISILSGDTCTFYLKVSQVYGDEFTKMNPTSLNHFTKLLVGRSVKFVYSNYQPNIDSQKYN